MSRRHALGQHMLIEVAAIEEIVRAARIESEDVVFELGVGTGNLTRLLCEKAALVVGYETDPALYEHARGRLKSCANLRLILDDGFSSRRRFDIFVSNPPYSQSRRLIEWLSVRRLKRGIVTLQQEFAEKILAPVGSRRYGEVSVLARGRFIVTPLRRLHRHSFSPPPRIASTIMILEPHRDPVNSRIPLMLKKVFSFRGRTVAATLKHLARDQENGSAIMGDSGRSFRSLRVEDLSPEESLRLAASLLQVQAED